MIDKKEVIEFFDKCAPGWDACMIRNDDIIQMILDNAGVKKDSRVLDVACGTGVLIPDYLSRDVSAVTAIDISSEMIKIAQSKFKDKRVEFICADVRLIEILSGKLKAGGRITVAHGMSREKIDANHKGRAYKVSDGLMEADRLADIFKKYTNVINVISDDNMYQVVGEVF